MIARLFGFFKWPARNVHKQTAEVLKINAGLQFIPGDYVAIIQPGVRRNRWSVRKVQHVRKFDSGYQYMVENIYYRAEQLERVEIPL